MGTHHDGYDLVARKSFADPEVIDSLVERKLMLELDGKVLSLAVRGDLPAMPRNIDFPGGCMDIDPAYVTPRKELSK